MRHLFKKAFVILFSVATMSACGTSNMNATSSAQLGGSQITSMTYTVSGGGDMQFTVSGTGYGAYMVNVARYNFQQLNRTVALYPNSAGYNLVTQIFNRQVTVVSNAGSPNGMYGGTWSQLTLTAGNNSVTIQSPSINGDTSQFQMLYQAVASQLGYY